MNHCFRLCSFGNIDEDNVVARCPVVLFYKQTGNGSLEILFDNLVACLQNAVRITNY